MLAFVMLLLRPYTARLHAESKAIAGMLSQLPAEVDVEGHVKAIVLNLPRRDGAGVGSLRAGMASLSAGPGGASIVI
jgi:hypothetical protein